VAIIKGRVWNAMLDFMNRSGSRRSQALAQRGLTPNDSRALFDLEVDGQSMGTLAHDWNCDPSTVTWIVDRLETLGLAERRAIANDRRVKLVGLTAIGQRTKEELMAELHRPPTEFAALDRQDLEALERILAKLSLAERTRPEADI
jgi:DNA-binding MarR family transcriptional regulator